MTLISADAWLDWPHANQFVRVRRAWFRYPHGVLAASVLQRMALAIHAVVRQLSRVGYTQETPTWGHVIGHFLPVLSGSILDTAAFDEV